MTSAFGPGRGSEVTPEERREIQRLRLIDGETISEIARCTSRNRETIANILRADDTRELQQQLEGEMRDAAKRHLQVTTEKAARAWGTAIQQAADKGDHRPAKDLLLHTGVIQPLQDSRMAIGVQVIVGSTEHPAGPDPFATVEAGTNGITPEEKP